MLFYSISTFLILFHSVVALPKKVQPQSRTEYQSWTLPSDFSSFDQFDIIQFDSTGKENCQIQTSGIPGEEDGNSVIQAFYPKGSINPGQEPVGGCQFYASTPLDLSDATSITFQYSVYFTPDFDFVKGGKLPGLYGGIEGCSGGNSAQDCWSSRMMWRTDGKGELYLYVPADKQNPDLCSIGPESDCNPDYGDSIGRGSFYFTRGGWTQIKQTINLSSSPDAQDGGFYIDINGQSTINYGNVAYPTGFKGIFFSTFFGGSSSEWAATKDEHTYFKDFSLSVNR